MFHFEYFMFILINDSEMSNSTSESREGRDRGPMIFYAQNAYFSHFFSLLASLVINFKYTF